MKDMSSRPRKRKDKEANTSYDEPKRHIVLSGKRNIVGVDDKTDMSEDHERICLHIKFLRVSNDETHNYPNYYRDSLLGVKHRRK